MPLDSLKQCIVIIAPQRSGTTVFQRSLSTNNQIITYGEVFHHHTQNECNFFNFLQANKEAASLKIYPTEENMISLFELYCDHLCSLTNKYYILDIKQNSLHHFDPVWQDITAKPFLLTLLQKNRVQIIRIKRRNIFQQVLSRYVARKMGQNHFTRDAAIPTLEPFSIKPEILYDQMCQIQAENKIFDAFLKDYQYAHFIYYEDMFKGDAFSGELVQILQKILKNDDDISHKIALKKINKDYHTFVKNREELIAFFQKTPFQKDVTASLLIDPIEQSRSFSDLFHKFFRK